MKRLLFISIFISFTLVVKSQDKDTTAQNIVFVVVEKQPEFPGGFDMLNKFIKNNLSSVVKNNLNSGNITGMVILNFVVERDGSLTNIKVIKSLSKEADNEAIRIMSRSPKWKPGIQNNRPVRVDYTIPIRLPM
jgi:protein TonB